MSSLEDLLRQKENIFDHILYEMEMFLLTEKLLANIGEIDLTYKSCIIPEKEITKQALINILIVSNHTHIRNLLCFFSPSSTRKKDDITSSTILEEVHCNELNFDTKKKEFICAKKLLNKTISHLTKTRLKPKSTIQSHSILDPIKLVLSEKICIFISLPSQAFKEEYQAHFNTEHTIELKQTISNLLDDSNYSCTPLI